MSGEREEEERIGNVAGDDLTDKATTTAPKRLVDPIGCGAAVLQEGRLLLLLLVLLLYSKSTVCRSIVQPLFL